MNKIGAPHLGVNFARSDEGNGVEKLLAREGKSQKHKSIIRPQDRIHKIGSRDKAKRKNTRTNRKKAGMTLEQERQRKNQPAKAQARHACSGGSGGEHERLGVANNSKLADSRGVASKPVTNPSARRPKYGFWRPRVGLLCPRVLLQLTHIGIRHRCVPRPGSAESPKEKDQSRHLAKSLLSSGAKVGSKVCADAQ